MSNNSVLLIGAANLDICGSPVSDFRLHDSNIGKISVSFGGVGRNIAHNLRLLGIDVSMITAFGNDMFASLLKNDVSSLGIDTSMSVFSQTLPSSVYMYITDSTGDMHTAINDMDVVSSVTPEHLEKHLDRIRDFSTVVIDTNLSAETIRYLAEISEKYALKIYADGVSAAKAEKLRGLLEHIFCLKLNRLEAEILTGESSPEAVVKELFRLGVKRPFVSSGKGGMITFDGQQLLCVPAQETICVNATGAGDAATAALVYAGLHGFSLKDSAELAVKAGTATVQTKEAVYPALAESLFPSTTKK